MFAFLGCNPADHGSSIEDLKGAKLGDLRGSPDGGIYMAIRAGESISQYEFCTIRGDFDIVDCSVTDPIGNSYCIPQVALSNNDYGWALVHGHGTVLANGAVTAANSASSSIQGDGRVADANTTDSVSGLMLEVSTSTANRSSACYAMFPKKVS